MSFNEEQFRRLVDETEKTIITLGTTAQAVLDRHRRFTEQLVVFCMKRIANLTCSYVLIM